jgi:lysozyme
MKDAEASALTWTQQQADNQLALDVSKATRAIPMWALSLDDVRQAVLVSMTFQLGAAGVAKFKRTLAAIRAGEYDKAGQYMAESLWAKQTPARASRAIKMMVTGEWPAKVNGVQVA